jgi:hypothetical protein
MKIVTSLILVLFASCVSTRTRSPVQRVGDNVTHLAQTAIEPASKEIRRRLDYHRAERYSELWIISAGEEEEYYGYALAKFANTYTGIAIVGKSGAKPSRISGWTPRSEWGSIERRLFTGELKSALKVGPSVGNFDIIHGTVLLISLKDAKTVATKAFYNPWERRTPTERVAVDTVRYIIDQAQIDMR